VELATIPQAVIPRLITAEYQVRARDSLYGICRGHSCNGTDFIRSTSGLSKKLSFHPVLYPFTVIRGTAGALITHNFTKPYKKKITYITYTYIRTVN